MDAARLATIDTAKGFSILLVVMMHATLGVAHQRGGFNWLESVVVFAQPFRMPAFFLLSGWMLAGKADRPWRRFLDEKLVHFAYFYVVWLSLQFAVKTPLMLREMGPLNVFFDYLFAYVEPFGTLWFIYLLPIFYVTTKLVRRAPVFLVLSAAAALHVAAVQTGWLVIDEFCARYVYFYSGYAFAAHLRSLLNVMERKIDFIPYALLAFGLVNLWCLVMGFTRYPGVTLVLGFAGAFAVVALAAFCVQQNWHGWVAYCGQRSLIIYLAFFLPMAAARTALLHQQVLKDAGTIALLVTLVAVVGPLLLHAAIQKIRCGRFLFVRPAWARLQS